MIASACANRACSFSFSRRSLVTSAITPASTPAFGPRLFELYSSYLSRWRRARERGQLEGLSSNKRGRKAGVDAGVMAEMAKLRREKERLQARLAQAEAIIEVQKKVSQLLGLSSEENGSTERR